ncbi:UNVERIFIED_CONTAM: KRUF family protein [Hammondia hammondi]|eukprot:XP_008888171.1 KRUF family protein [Hammondia hammondi]
MVARLALLSTAIAAISCSVEQDSCNRLSLGWIPLAWVLSGNRWAAALAFLRNADQLLCAFAARVPGAEDVNVQDIPLQSQADSQIEQGAAEARLALGSSLAVGTSRTRDETPAPAAEPTLGAAGSTPRATDTSPRSSRPAAKRNWEKDSGIKSSAPGGLGLARTVSLEGRGEVTYGQLAIEKLRRDAKDIRDEWGDEETYVKIRLGRRMMTQRASGADLQTWRWAAVSRYRLRSAARLGQASDLEALANRVGTMLEAAGVDVSGSGGDSVSRPETTEGASRTDGDGLTPDVASDTSASGSSSGTYLQVGVNKLKKEAAALRKLAENKDLYIAQQVGVRMAQSRRLDPSNRQVDQYRSQARSQYVQRLERWLRTAAQREALAGEWEKQIAAGAVTPLGPVEGTSSSKKAIKEAAGPDSTAGRPAARGRGRRKRESRDEGTTATVPPESSESGAPKAKAQMSSLSGTLLGSTVTVPGHGTLPYAQLAMDGLRRRALVLTRDWEDRGRYIRSKLASRLIRNNDRNPPPATWQRWIQEARGKHAYFACLRLQDAADLRRVADKLEKEAAAAGVFLRTSQEISTLPSESAGHPQAAQGEESPGPSHVSTLQEADLTFAHLAITNLRRQAQEIRSLWCTGKEMYTACQLAERMVRFEQPSPPAALLTKWLAEARLRHGRSCSANIRKAERLEAQALALEHELDELLSATSAIGAEPSPDIESTEALQEALPYLRPLVVAIQTSPTSAARAAHMNRIG